MEACVGVSSEDRTHACRNHNPRPYHLAIDTIISQIRFGIPPGIRTPSNGFGDRYAAVKHQRDIMVEVVRFELTIGTV